MAEGAVTRAKDHAKQISKLHDKYQEHTTTIADLQKYTADKLSTLTTAISSHSTILQDVVAKLSTLTLPTTTAPPPPLLPLPQPSSKLSSPFAAGSSSNTFPPPGDPSVFPPPRLPKLEIPLFSGDNVQGWVFQMERFFTYHRTPPDQKMTIAAFYMTGIALQWFQWMHSTSQLSSWEVFTHQLDLRFGPSKFINHEAQLYKLKQTSTVEAYLADFENVSTRVTGLSHANMLNCFISGLHDDIQRELSILKPYTLHEAMGLAKLLEDKCNTAKPFFKKSTAFPTPSASTKPATPLPLKRLTPAEMATRRAQGLCFNCDDKFVPGHRCRPPQFLCLMTENDGVPNEVQLAATEVTIQGEQPELMIDHPQISFHAFTGQLIRSTLKLAGSINGQSVVVLIDGGSTNNFIQSRLTKHLGLTVQTSPHLKVTIGNGDSLGCAGACSRVPLVLGEAYFAVDLLLLPIYGADLVLGVQWLSELGPILFDYKKLWMEFDYKGVKTKLHGLTQPSIAQMTLNPLSRSLQTDSIAHFYLLSVDHVPTSTEPKIGVQAPPHFRQQLQSLLNQFR
ncbi:hypothetical protein CK203_052825 [Vitis vinifera]|uniref:Ty3 transposon capsid-like protein domain-containing protein n=1 Tax=Vitis vinifera TaxID=29760 RepID=A0A438GUV4_VITVI|nr:hypothetical protein CK203_052825 [Vitis vinifera]